jgi:hypothetical protein
MVLFQNRHQREWYQLVFPYKAFDFRRIKRKSFESNRFYLAWRLSQESGMCPKTYGPVLRFGC